MITSRAIDLPLATFVAPIFALLMGILAFDEVLSPFQVMGTALILLALIVINRRALRTELLKKLRPNVAT
jgi:drug/metabolite transporter (DMT)-like permease